MTDLKTELLEKTPAILPRLGAKRYSAQVLSDVAFALLTHPIPADVGTPEGWVLGVARNKLRDIRRSRTRERVISIDSEPYLRTIRAAAFQQGVRRVNGTVLPPRSHGQESCSLLIQKELHRSIIDAILAVVAYHPPKRKRATLEYLLEDAQIASLSRKLSVPVQTVYSWIRRDKEKLKHLLRPLIEE